MKMLRDKEELLMCDEMTNSHPSHHSLSLENLSTVIDRLDSKFVVLSRGSVPSHSASASICPH